MDFRESVFNLMKSFGFTMKMFDTEGNGPLVSPLSADYFYCKKSEQIYMIVIEDDSTRQYKHVSLYKSNNENEEEFRKILKRLNILANTNMFTVTVKNFGRSFSPKDFSIDPVIKKEKREKENIEESFSVQGTKKTSYHVNETAKVVVKHKKEVDENSYNPRSRNISAVYVATKGGERRKVSEHSLAVGKAIANYINHGGTLFDENTNTIVHLGEDLSTLKKLDLNETTFNIRDGSKNEIHKMAENARKMITKFLGRIGNRKRPIEQDLFEMIKSPQYDFSRSYYEALVGDDKLAECLARASVFSDYI